MLATFSPMEPFVCYTTTEIELISKADSIFVYDTMQWSLTNQVDISTQCCQIYKKFEWAVLDASSSELKTEKLYDNYQCKVLGVTAFNKSKTVPALCMQSIFLRTDCHLLHIPLTCRNPIQAGSDIIQSTADNIVKDTPFAGSKVPKSVPIEDCANGPDPTGRIKYN